MKWRASALAPALALAACAGQHGHPVADTPVKIGRPYQVHGQWYSPADDRGYNEVGMASWYGPGFHGQATANGERFDARMVGAAHKTLPLPCYVEVTALDSGRRIIARVNDRGPFVAGRIIDLSQRAAELLGTARAGVTAVRVRRVFPDDRTRAALRSGKLAPELAYVPSSELAKLRARLAGAQDVLAPSKAHGYQGASPIVPPPEVTRP